ncbi:hypothetical protein FPF71_07955 [Algibacter amylolyticus]|uniref:Uncharacterized protein n=1 Tax=Algibacter amylolyticus TaxID=1608400 RepID=A0A5M7B8U3_9FLAO|nr:hypothetical protein [Algibacter amylolyticus]KAA5825120.1 hypothetical protein F2B50_07955 [Algibacter amylolyticus]MBB5268772.1 hypothetical protein [Algibacter amylolyticus]TSJ77614.1 hypothetical protein FPF71_07955 [Algibacter amylolyticus]
MKSKITTLTFLLVITLFSCNQGSQFSDFKYADKPATITCEGVNLKLLNEALYSFEDDIAKHYNKGNGTPRLDQAYSQIIRNSIYGRLKIEDIASKHTVAVFEALKKEEDLWDANNIKSHLNYKSKVLNCISSSIKDASLKTTLNALISTNSMAPKLFGPAIVNKSRNALSDKNLAMYITLDLFYAKMFDIDFSKVNLEKPEKKVDFNAVPATEKPVADPHAGHNH